MITMYAPEENQVIDYSNIIDSALLKLRKELRMDLNQIVSIEWCKDTSAVPKEEKQVELIEDPILE